MIKKLFVAFLGVYLGYQFWDSFNPESIKGKNVVITGASTGIGEQLAYQYARLGANIVITARREELLIKVVNKCKDIGKNGGKYLYISLDMGHNDATKRLVEFAENNLHGIDILVLNHKIPSLRKWLGTPEDFNHLYDTININFYAYVSAATFAIPALTKAKGSIIVLNSVAGKIPSPNLASYSSSKHALEGFFGSLRDEFIMGNTDISITLCTLGFIDTENAMTGMKEFGATKLINSIKAVRADDTALAIVRAGAERLHRMYFPYASTKFTVSVYTFIPETVSQIFRYFWEN